MTDNEPGRHLDVLLEVLVDRDTLRAPDGLEAALLTKVTEIVRCDMAAIRRPDPTRTVLRMGHIHGAWRLRPEHRRAMRAERLDLATLDGSVVRPGPRSPSVEAFLSGTIDVVADIEQDPSGFVMHSMTAVPLVRGGGVSGVLTLYWMDRHVPDHAEQTLLTRIGHHVAFVLDVGGRVATTIERARLLAESETAARVDQRDAEKAIALLTAGLSTLDERDGLSTLLRDLDDGSPDFAARVTVDGEVVADRGSGDPTGWGLMVRADAEEAVLATSLPAPSARWAAAADVRLRTVLDRAAAARATDGAATGEALRTLCEPGTSRAARRTAGTDLGLAHAPAVPVVVACPDAETAYHAMRTLRRSSAQVPAIAVADHVVVLLHGEGGDLDRALSRLQRLPGCRGVGVARRTADPGQMAREVERAQTAAQLSVARGTPVHADESGNILDLAALVPGPAAREILGGVLAPVLDYDRRRHTDLLATLRALLDADGSPTLTARRMHLHVNTVKQRVARIESLLGCTLGDYRTVTRLSLAITWLDMTETAR
ncbi:MAG: helix-turn-helix domain-containing protein [Nocardioides sp.]|uniref:helix-turn-helix domain-containing protein n=1 Tax=Nocardioides sp. TaxID=35761 RepID=UPI0039E7235C